MSMVTNLAIEQKGTLTRTRTMGRGQKVTSMPIILVKIGLFYGPMLFNWKLWVIENRSDVDLSKGKPSVRGVM